MTDDIIMIIIVPCSETIVRYWPGGEELASGLSSSARISIALSPPMKKKNADADEVLQSDDLVVGREAEVATEPRRLRAPADRSSGRAVRPTG